jgi:hypothetical protein
MFYYFGRKGRLAPHYPDPAFSVIIEPFAGSMAYSFHHRPILAIGIEADPRVVTMWERVVARSACEILTLPEPVIGERVTDRWAMMAAGSHGTAKAESYLWTERMARDFRKQRRMAAAGVEYARANIDYQAGDYRDAPDIAATWFIDPPYQHVNRGYRHRIDYAELAEWVLARRGQVIVCEQQGADWLPFRPLKRIRGTNNRETVEVMYHRLDPDIDPRTGEILTKKENPRPTLFAPS